MAKDVKKSNDSCMLTTLAEDHKEFKELFRNVQASTTKIETNTEKASDILKSFHEDNIEYMKILAGKKQVPLSIFAIVVILLSSLLIASEVRYSGLDIEITTNGIKITRTIK